MLNNFKHYCILIQKKTRLPYIFSKQNDYATEAKLEIKQFKLHNLKEGPPTHTVITKKDALLYYRQLKLVRDMEAQAAKLYREKKVYGFCHLCTGQEAVGVGLKAAMRPKDMIISSYRIHGITYLMGSSVGGVLAELTGRSSGISRGKGGSMHMYGTNFYGGNGIVGSQVPLGAGLAFASQYRKEDAVTFTLYGDGAANQGQVFETYNLAKIWNLPIIFICENNLYAMGTSAERSSANINYYTRGDTIPGLWVNGMGVLSVREAARFAIEHVKAGKGPMVIEIETYRYHGHSMSDPGTSYRSRDEVAEVRKTHDPINMFKDRILEVNLVTDNELKVEMKPQWMPIIQLSTPFQLVKSHVNVKRTAAAFASHQDSSINWAIDADVKKEVDVGVKMANNDPEPSLDEIATDIYSMPLEENIRGTHPWHILKHRRIGKTENL